MFIVVCAMIRALYRPLDHDHVMFQDTTYHTPRCAYTKCAVGLTTCGIHRAIVTKT